MSEIKDNTFRNKVITTINKKEEWITNKSIEDYIKEGYILICGTHKKIDYYNKFVKKEFSSLDGRFWYKNQRIYTINEYGNC